MTPQCPPPPPPPRGRECSPPPRGRAARPAQAVRSPRVLAAGRRRRRLRIPLLPRTIDRYVATIFLGAYFICAVSFCGIYIMVEALTKLDRLLQLPGALFVSLPPSFA